MVGNGAKFAEALVESPEYQAILTRLAEAIAIPLENDYQAILAEFDGEIIELSGLTKEEIKSTVVFRSEYLTQYSIKKFLATDSVLAEQEYPVGEEPDEEPSESSGGVYSQGLLIMNAIELNLAEKGMPLLVAFLKAARIPKAGIYAKKIQSFLD
jgi:hypothetical protein